MRKLLWCPSCMVFVITVLIGAPATANASTPSQEFWEYMTAYSDEKGDVLDPLEYDQILRMKENNAVQNKDANITKKTATDKPKVRSTDMKLEQTSSLQQSSANAKGAKL